MAYRHFFRCGLCKMHVYVVSDYDVPSAPARLHGDALKLNGLPLGANDAGDDCPGTLEFCPGTDKNGKDCAPRHKGTETFNPPPPPVTNKEWIDFAARVSSAWHTFASSGYNLAYRGANNFREYKLTKSVRLLLQMSGGAVVINGATYTISNSLHAGVSLHRDIPPEHRIGHIQSFIFHL